MIKIGLVDDQPLVRAGFGMLISSQSDMEVAWQVTDGDEIPLPSEVDVILMDVQMRRVNGIEACKTVLASDPDVRIIMLTTFDDFELVGRSLDAGASGFLLKDAEPEEFLAAIRTVVDGNAVLAPRVTKHVISAALNTHAVQRVYDERTLDELTQREREVLRLMALGLSNEEIAKSEVISMATVKTHVRHILIKTDSRDRVHAVLFAVRTGLVTQQELLSPEKYI